MGIIGFIRKLSQETEDKEQGKVQRDQTPEQIQQTRRCNNCGGHLMGNRIKGSQMICANCGNRVYLY